jgi:filamentous hemagglutinin
LTINDLQRLVNNKDALKVLDKRSGHINVIQQVEGNLIRITTTADDMKIISVGPIRQNQIDNLISKGEFVPLSGGR